MADAKKIYWDACLWIALLRQNEGDRTERCEGIIDQAKKGDVQIWTSSLALAEVYKVKCDGGTESLQAEKDALFEQYLQQDFVVEVQLDHSIAVAARRLLRANPALKKPNDGIHLATAVLHSVDEMHTFDEENLIKLDGKISKRDGSMLKICQPPKPTNIQLQLDVAPAPDTTEEKPAA